MRLAVVTVAAAAGLVGLVTAGCGVSGHPAATRTVTHTVIKWKTKVVTAPAAATERPSPTVTSPAAHPGSGSGSGANQILDRFNGSGTQNTATFTTPDRWHLSWSYWGCPDGESNFQVTEYDSDGSLDFNGISVNELGTGRGPVATYAYGDAGTHYLSIDTEGCSWSLVPVTG
jgi:hypothetical protein